MIPFGTQAVMFAIAVVATVWDLLWLGVPDLIFGMNRQSKDQAAARQETNRLLRVLANRESAQREESAKMRSLFWGCVSFQLALFFAPVVDEVDLR